MEQVTLAPLDLQIQIRVWRWLRDVALRPVVLSADRPGAVRRAGLDRRPGSCLQPSTADLLDRVGQVPHAGPGDHAVNIACPVTYLAGSTHARSPNVSR